MSRITQQLKITKLWLVRHADGTAKLYTDAATAQQAGKPVGRTIWKARVNWTRVQKVKKKVKT